MTGRVIAGRYRLIQPIGRGAMGVVWRATDQLLDRDVAVKEVRLNEALGDVERANAYKRTLREARTAARLSHRGVVTIFDVAEEDGRPWIIMELHPVPVARRRASVRGATAAAAGRQGRTATAIGAGPCAHRGSAAPGREAEQRPHIGGRARRSGGADGFRHRPVRG